MAFKCGSNEVGSNSINGYGDHFFRVMAIRLALSDARRARDAMKRTAIRQLQAFLDKQDESPCPDNCPHASADATDNGETLVNVVPGPWGWHFLGFFWVVPMLVFGRIHYAHAKAHYKEWIVCRHDPVERPGTLSSSGQSESAESS